MGPTDEAFAEALTALNTDAATLLGENIDTATTILKYHLQELPIEDGTVVGACNNATVLATAPVSRAPRTSSTLSFFPRSCAPRSREGDKPTHPSKTRTTCHSTAKRSPLIACHHFIELSLETE